MQKREGRKLSKWVFDFFRIQMLNTYQKATAKILRSLFADTELGGDSVSVKCFQDLIWRRILSATIAINSELVGFPFPVSTV